MRSTGSPEGHVLSFFGFKPSNAISYVDHILIHFMENFVKDLFQIRVLGTTTRMVRVIEGLIIHTHDSSEQHHLS
jgi:hypothetical protein